MRDYQEFLKKQDKFIGHNPNSVWTISNLEAGFEKFYDDNGHYPSAPELDKFEYLPSSRQIQRVFGGLQKLRKDMKLEHEASDHNSGKIRSKMAGEAWARAVDYEEEYYKYLIQQIPELYVHEHKVIRHDGYKTDTDFFIYFPNSNDGIVIDVFYAMDILSLIKQVRIKEKKYAPMPYKTFFISINKKISQEEIDDKILNRNSTLPKNIHVCSIHYFNSEVLPTIKSRFS